MRLSVPILLLLAFAAGCSAHSSKSVSQPTTISPNASIADAGAPIETPTAPTAHPFADVSLGEQRACAVSRDGEVWCWMRSFGNGTRLDIDEPRRIEGLTDVVRASVGRLAVYALRRQGDVVCVGCGPSPSVVTSDAVDVSSGGNGTCTVSKTGKVACAGVWDKAPSEVARITDAVRVSVGRSQTCVLHRAGTVTCFKDDPTHTVTLTGVADATAIAVGNVRGCAIRASGGVACWGEGDLGDGATMDELRERPRLKVVEVKGIRDAIAITDGCVVEKSGRAQCWGVNYYGRIGDGTRTDRPVPTPVVGLPAVMRIESSDERTCAVATNGALHCWGDFPRFRPTLVKGIDDATSVSAGSDNTCATRKGGALSCWGARDVLTGGDLSCHDSNEPEDRYSIHDALFVATTTPSSHIYDACIVHGAGEVVCHNDSGVVRPGVTDATRVAIGQGHACALRAGGRVACWGANQHAQCGEGTSEEMKSAHDVGVTDASAIAAGGDTTCVILRSGGVTCWGGNHWGQLGGKTDDAKHPQPSAVRGLGDVVDLSLGFTHACAVRRAGEVVCWGNNLGSVVNVETLDLKEPTRIGISDAVKVSAGTEATCVVRKSGKVTCVALSSSRGMDVMRGGGPYEEDQRAFDIPGLADVANVSVGDKHACALRRDGAVLCWGDNQRGQIGDGTGPRVPHVVTVAP